MDAIDRSKLILQTSKDTLVTATEIAKGRYSERFLAAIDHALMFKSEDRPQTVAEWRKEFDLPADPIKEAITIEQQVTQLEATALARQQDKKLIPLMMIAFFAALISLVATIYFNEEINQIIQSIDIVSGGQNENVEIESLLTAAQTEQPAGNRALANYRRVLQLQPNNAEARLGLQIITSQLASNARDEIKTGDFSAAEKSLAEAAAILPDDAGIKLISDELAQAKVAHNNKLAKAKVRAEQLESAIKKAQTAADKGQVTETFSLIEQARILDADNQSIVEIKNRLHVALETQSTLATMRAKKALKNKDTKSARRALLRAKEINAQLNKLNLPKSKMAGANKILVLLNVAKAATAEGDLDLAIEKFKEARSMGGDADAITEVKNQLELALETQATEAAAEAQQAIKDNKSKLARKALKYAKDIKAKLEQIK